MKTPFDELSYQALLFLEEKTRDQEPWSGFGFATEVHRLIAESLEKKKEKVNVYTRKD